MSRLVSRDPFAREELYRDAVYGDAACRDCGSRRVTRSGRRYLYRYHKETDSGRRYDIAGEFCGIGCCRSYHDGLG